MKSFGRKNVRKHKEIKGSDNYVTLDIFGKPTSNHFKFKQFSGCKLRIVPPPLYASLGMVGTKSGNIEPASSPPLPDRAEREQQESPRLEPRITNPQQKMTVYSDSPFDGNINTADSSGLKLSLSATKGPDSKERITLHELH